MKKLKLKECIEIVFAAIIISLALFEAVALMSWRFQQLDKNYIQEEYNKKTDTSQTYISQN